MDSLAIILSFLIFFFPLNTQGTNNSFDKEFYYVQTLDHFGYGVASVTAFPQRYFLDDRYWNGGLKPSGPIFVFFGGESPIDSMPGNVGLLNDCASQFGALILYIEHRFYGKSVPLGSIDLAMTDPDTRNYLTSEQSLADFAEIILSVKANHSTTNSGVIVVGGSYAGLLAAWFRLKYPHIAFGALASSAPILSFDGSIPEYAACDVVSKDFQEIDERCYDTIRHSWATIDKIASQVNGLDILSLTFNTCRTLKTSNALKTYLANLYTVGAQYNGQFNSFIRLLCSAINGLNDSIKGISKAVSLTVGNDSCLEIIDNGDSHSPIIDMNSFKAWDWQLCTELVVPKGCRENSMLPQHRFNLTTYTRNCLHTYGVLPRSQWVRTYYGGHTFWSL
ncbi:hypothetical protein RND81_12G191900 [Saponaria officinalis]|uniref:Lysosomal Pro-Xaa carboxypeptidase n=1 Tax=Saponaria officinalis TaxID=3572 RepID=A0AAW1HCT4_SAPOF